MDEAHDQAEKGKKGELTFHVEDERGRERGSRDNEKRGGWRTSCGKRKLKWMAARATAPAPASKEEETGKAHDEIN